MVTILAKIIALVLDGLRYYGNEKLMANYLTHTIVAGRIRPQFNSCERNLQAIFRTLRRRNFLQTFAQGVQLNPDKQPGSVQGNYKLQKIKNKVYTFQDVQ